MAETNDIEVGFVHSKTVAQALTDSTTHQGKVYFPTDDTCIVKNGKKFGVDSRNVPNDVDYYEDTVTLVENTGDELLTVLDINGADDTNAGVMTGTQHSIVKELIQICWDAGLIGDTKAREMLEGW